MSPIIIFIGDMLWINMFNQIYLTGLFLFLLYVDKKWPHITPSIWLFVTVNFSLNTVYLFSIAIYTTALNEFTGPILLSTLFTTSSIIPVIVFGNCENKIINVKPTVEQIIATIIVPIIISVNEMMLAIFLQI